MMITTQTNKTTQPETTLTDKQSKANYTHTKQNKQTTNAHQASKQASKQARKQASKQTDRLTDRGNVFTTYSDACLSVVAALQLGFRVDGLGFIVLSGTTCYGLVYRAVPHCLCLWTFLV